MSPKKRANKQDVDNCTHCPTCGDRLRHIYGERKSLDDVYCIELYCDSCKRTRIIVDCFNPGPPSWVTTFKT